MTAVLERELIGELLYQPEKAKLPVDGDDVCDEDACEKIAIWEF